MKKNTLQFGLLALALLIPAQTFAGYYDARTVAQGQTVELFVPADNVEKVEGSFDGEPIYFYPIEREPKFDEPITRAEFLKLMFQNHDFGEVDISNAQIFPDVPKDHPYYNEITKAAALNIINGYEDGYFRPYTTITRGQAAKIVVQAFDPEPVLDEAPRFTDIPNNHRFFEHVNAAVRAEIFKGYPDGLMRPDREINFSEAEIVMDRAANPDELIPFGEKSYFRGFLGIHRLSDLTTKNVNLTITQKPLSQTEDPLQTAHATESQSAEETIPLSITASSYPTISFSMQQGAYDLFAEEKLDQTWKLIDEARANPNPEKLWKGKFIMPTTGELTLGYGDKLYINGSYAGSHFGLDWANAEGTEIYASNTGIVTLSSDTPSYGNVIIIDHGQNVFTMYLHMSKLIATKGQKVQKGDLIGKMGATGIATGSHLHFTQFIGSIIVDNNEWLEQEFN
ncbi:S-layer homology domain-containing protein [Candidatus Peregrinibacteria bacterium]|nr:S-layer homology domain-containing protein [Candidatus Peregrinibacteria bacterium]